MRIVNWVFGLLLVFSSVQAAVVPLPLMAMVPSGFTDGVFATGISSGTAMAFAPDGRLFVCEQGGALKVYSTTGASLGTAITLSVNSSGERGLLGIAFDPNFGSNGYLYLYYTVSS